MKPIHYLAGFAWINMYAMCWALSLGYANNIAWNGIGALVYFFVMAFTFSMIAIGKQNK